MGQVNSNCNYIYSYSKQYNCEKETEIESINLDSLLIENNLIYSSFFYKLKHNGYSIKLNNYFTNENISLNKIIQKVINRGFKSSRNFYLKDLIITPKCYFVTKNNIKYLLSTGNVLLGGIYIDPEFINAVNYPLKEIITTDIILIIGFNEKGIIIKTNHGKIIEIPDNFINNIKEMWDIMVNSPEELFLNENLNNV